MLKKKWKIFFSVLLCLAVTVTGAFAAETPKSEEQVKEYIQAILLLTEQLSVTEMDKSEMMYEALVTLAEEDEEAFNKVLAAIAGTVDENSTFIPDEDYKQLMQELSGEIGGIGIIVTVKDGFLNVVSVLADSPAEQAGIVGGDKITEINGRDFTGAAAASAVEYLRGEVGTQVTITILSENGLKRQATLTRYLIPDTSVQHTVLEDNIGYVSISTFAANTDAQVDEALKDLKEQGVTKLILDLRDNGGGVFEAGVNVANMFLDEGKTIVTIQGRNEKDSVTYTATKYKYDFDVCVLVNEYTASASEIVTGALKDNQAAYILGETTYGKGTVQGLFPLTEIGGALKLTIQTYKTPSGIFIHKEGIAPNQTVEIERKKYTAEELPKLTFDRVLRVGDTGEDVKNIKYLLDLLNYSIGEVNETYDEATAIAVEQFQASVALYPYGVCDLTTQSYLRDRVLEITFRYDNQLPVAIEYLKAR